MSVKHVVRIETVGDFLDMPFAWQEAARKDIEVKIYGDVVGVPEGVRFCVACFKDHEVDVSPVILPVVNLMVEVSEDNPYCVDVEASCATPECADCGSDYLYSDLQDYADDLRDQAMLDKWDVARDK